MRAIPYVEEALAVAQSSGHRLIAALAENLLGLCRVADRDWEAARTAMTQDKLWGWFNDIRDKGILLSDRSNNRKSGSIVMYDSTNAEIARFNFTNGWPSKIATDQLSVESNDPVKETITLTVESLARVK